MIQGDNCVLYVNHPFFVFLIYVNPPPPQLDCVSVCSICHLAVPKTRNIHVLILGLFVEFLL